MRRIGVLGGTFDPPHYAHLILAEHARDQLSLDLVLWVPVGVPPHKPNRYITPVETRIEMLKLALGSNPAFEISRADADRAGPHYSADMLSIIRREEPDADFYFLMGADSFADLVNWHQPQRLIAQAKLAIMHRPSVHYNFAEIASAIPGIEERIVFIDAPLVEIAASTIRRHYMSGRSIRYLLPESILEYIEQYGLYKQLTPS